MIPVGDLQHAVRAGERGDRETFDREGYVVGRGAFDVAVLRAVRAPLIDALLEDGHIELVDGDDDRFRWIGDIETFSQRDYAHLLQATMDDLLLPTGVAGAAIEAMWSTRPALWELAPLVANPPGISDRVRRAHRDALPMAGVGQPRDHVRLWCPLTRIDQDDGAIGVAAGSHRIADLPGDGPACPLVVHDDLPQNTRNWPPDEVLAPRWRTTRFEVGDALLFRPDLLHGTQPNRGPYLRLAMLMDAQDAGVRLPLTAGLSLDSTRDLTDIEWVVLSLMAIQPMSPWTSRCAGYARGIVGRLWAEQPKERVERSFATLRARGLIEPHESRDDSPWPIQRHFLATAHGAREARRWLATASGDDPRLTPLKQRLCEQLDLDMTAPLAAEPHRHSERPRQSALAR